MNSRKQAVAARFGAADGYDRAAAVQRLAATRLARRIAASGVPPHARILEVGSGTGLLTASLRELLPQADWTVTDLSPAMLLRGRRRFAADPRMRFLAMDAEAPSLRPGFDLICGGLALQWFNDRRTALRGLAGLLADGGLLALSTLCAESFSFWRAALACEHVPSGMPQHPDVRLLQAEWPEGGVGEWQTETLLERHAHGIDLLRGLRAIGADLPRDGVPPASPTAMRRVLRRFETEHGAVADYQIGYGLFRAHSRGTASRGVFVTGTDTGVGKTLVAACLVSAWQASYWKPLQTGLSQEPGDTETVTRLAGLTAARTIPPLHELQAPLSPEAAASDAGVALDTRASHLPRPGSAPLVVEGAGGLMVPIGSGEMMIDLIRRLGLPVVLVARGTLGTINHTLLSLQALRAHGIPVAGVVLNGETTASNREAISTYGKVEVLAQLPWVERLDAEAVAQLAKLMPACIFPLAI